MLLNTSFEDCAAARLAGPEAMNILLIFLSVQQMGNTNNNIIGNSPLQCFSVKEMLSCSQELPEIQ
jgi:hypothetical protein